MGVAGRLLLEVRLHVHICHAQCIIVPSVFKFRQLIIILFTWCVNIVILNRIIEIEINHIIHVYIYVYWHNIKG